MKTRELSIAVLSLVVFSLVWPLTLVAQQEDDLVQRLMDRMSVEDKVGQLFLVTFEGHNLSAGSDIVELITEYRVGGVVLQASNRNFVNGENAPDRVARLTNGLQNLALTAGQPLTGSVPVTVDQPLNGIPLFIALDHEGDGYPYTDLRGGMTALPNNMALAATWDESAAEKVGHIVGRELEAVGINMVFGPSLDVLDNPRPGLKGDLGTRVFGGDPYWVGKMGRAYIRGLHQGSKGRVVSVAKHFPGLGSSDRRADEEVSTVPKSLQELKKIELAPFFAVTQPNDPQATTEALMSSHIRYRGFQGNIRQLTRPISFDAKSLQALLNEPELKAWRQRGGIMVTGALGVPAVRKYYDPQLQTFPHKRIAQEAFLAGNDLLVLSQFGLHDVWAEQFENIKDTIRFFGEKYTSDPTFRARVDESLRRILRLKQQLYPHFSLEESLVDPDRLSETVGVSQRDISQIAQKAVTLIYPGPQELADRLPAPPLIDEHILIFIDNRQGQDCTGCEPFYFIEPDALQSIILQLYGPQASGQVNPAHIKSLTFSELRGHLLAETGEVKPPPPSPTPEADTATATVEAAPPLTSTVTATAPSEVTPPSTTEGTAIMGIEALLQEADWIIFAMLDVNLDDYPESDTVKLFLKQRSDSLRAKKVVVMAYNAPYYLDTTEISKLTAYYGLYSKVPPFLEVSVRILFQEFTPQVYSPVSVKGVNYDLIARLAPDPEQVIAIEAAPLQDSEEMALPETPTPIRPELEGTPAPMDVEAGVTMRLRTGVIVDRNGHPVPDGTPVVFRLFYPSESLELPRQEVMTVEGRAETIITLQRTGQLEITATSDPALRSATVLITIGSQDEPATIATVMPSPTATPTATPTPTSLPASVPTIPLTFASPPFEEGQAASGGLGTQGKPRLNETDLLLSLGGMVLAAGVSYLLRGDWKFPQTRRLQFFLSSLAWGLVGYVLYGLGLLGMGLVWQFYGHWGAPLVCFLFGLLPLSYTLWEKMTRWQNRV